MPYPETKIDYSGLAKINFSNNKMLILLQKYKIYGFWVIYIIKKINKKFQCIFSAQEGMLKQGPQHIV